MNASTERQQKPGKAIRRSCSARSSSSSKKRKSASAGINSSNAPKCTARNRHIKTPNAGGVVESKTANVTTDSSTDGSTDSVSTDNDDDADDVRSSWPQRRIAIIPTPLPRPPNNASINDLLTTSDDTPLFKNHVSKPANNIDGASPTENGFRNDVYELRALNERKIDSHRRGTTIDTTEDLVTIRSNIVKFARNNNQEANLGGMPTKETWLAQVLQYATNKEIGRVNDSDKVIHNYCTNGSECPRWINDILQFSGERFCESFTLTKSQIQSRILNIDIIPFVFDVDTSLAELGRPADGKTQRTMNRELKKLESYAKERKFPSVNAAVRRICCDLHITEDELYGYAREMLVYCAIECYIRTSKPMGVVCLTARSYKLFNVREGQIEYNMHSNIMFLIGRLPHPQKTNQYGGIHLYKEEQINGFDYTLAMAALVTRVFSADFIGFHYFRAKALKKLSKMTPEERELERQMNSEKGRLAWNVSVTKNALDRMLSGNEKKGDKEIVLRHPHARECLLWHIIRTEGDGEDGDIVAYSLLSPAELKKLKQGSQSFKVTVAWSLLRHMEANGETWPTIEEVKALPSDDPLSCLAKVISYITKLAWRILREKKANGETWPSIEQLKALPSDDPLSCLATNLHYKVKLAWRILREKEEKREAWPSIEQLKALPSDHPLSCLAKDISYIKKLKMIESW
eukprot:scaffold21539_cov48-Cyclotella_meneghiniana.AAC.1